MTRKELLDNIIFNSNEEYEEALKYIEIKGIAQYGRILNYCVDFSIEPTYVAISSLYRYDKRLRYNVYRYLGTVEEYIRAILGNNFENDQNGLSKTKVFSKHYENINSLSLALERLTFNELINLVLLNKIFFANFFNLDNLSINFNALRVLRNKVCHHNFLLIEKYEFCVTDKFTSKSLENNLKNLKNHLPKLYQKGFISDITKCSRGLDLHKISIIGME